MRWDEGSLRLIDRVIPSYDPIQPYPILPPPILNQSYLTRSYPKLVDSATANHTPLTPPTTRSTLCARDQAVKASCAVVVVRESGGTAGMVASFMDTLHPPHREPLATTCYVARLPLSDLE